MDTNTCNVNDHLDMDALLPPRKRLLAGFKRHNFDVNSHLPSRSLNSPLMSNPNLSIEDIVEASNIAAIEATKVAKAAKAKAEEKAAKAAKAVIAAKNALNLVAALSHETSKTEKNVKKNKTKKRITVEELYDNNRKKVDNRCGEEDEELARNLHRDINSSPRISKNCHRHKKKLKSSGFPIRSEITNVEGNQTFTATSNVVGNVDVEGPMKKIDVVMVDLNTLKLDKNDQRKLDNDEGIRPGKKKGRIAQKKLLLSICNNVGR